MLAIAVTNKSQAEFADFSGSPDDHDQALQSKYCTVQTWWSPCAARCTLSNLVTSSDGSYAFRNTREADAYWEHTVRTCRSGAHRIRRAKEENMGSSTLIILESLRLLRGRIPALLLAG